MGYGTLLKEARKESGMSQDEVARLAGVSRATISYYENEQRTPDVLAIEKIARVLGRDPAELIGWKAKRTVEARDSMTQEEKMERDREERWGRLKRADEKVIEALDFATNGLEKGAQILNECDLSKAEALGVMTTMAQLCKEMSKLRSSMNDHPWFGYGV